MVNLIKRFKLKNSTAINFVDLNKEEKAMVRRWRNNKNIRRWLYTDHIISAKEHSRFIEALKDDDKNAYWLIKNRSGEFLGTVSLNRINLKNRSAYLGIYANPEVRQPRTGHGLIAFLKKIAFGIFKLHTLKLEVIADNKRAIDFYIREGFSKKGELRDFVFKNRRWMDVVVMGIINNAKK